MLIIIYTLYNEKCTLYTLIKILYVYIKLMVYTQLKLHNF